MASRYNSIAAAAAGASALLQAAAILLDLGVKPSVSSTYRETRLRWHRTGFAVSGVGSRGDRLADLQSRPPFAISSAG